jgi:ElaB/YqjD/DUF883 family membrane-anchored ribosome-binding protein
MNSISLKAELDAIRAELAELRHMQAGAPAGAGEAAIPAVEPATGGIGDQIAELNSLVHQMLADAEDTITDHPVATVAGALALGIVIGRLTAR